MVQTLSLSFEIEIQPCLKSTGRLAMIAATDKWAVIKWIRPPESADLRVRAYRELLLNHLSDKQYVPIGLTGGLNDSIGTEEQAGGLDAKRQ